VRVLLSRRRTLTLIKVSLLGAAQICVHLALYILTAPFAGPKAFLHRIGMAKGLGKLTWRKPIGFIDERAA
jgi:hypothetical protein